MTLQDNMIATIKTFKKYAGKDGKGDTLSKGELFDLQHQKKDEILNEVFAQMDFDGDNQVNLKEFVIFLSCLTLAIGEGI